MTLPGRAAKRPLAPGGILYIIAVLRPLIKAFCVKEVCSPVIYVTGDLHGDIERFADKAVKKLKKGDTLIVLGDFGFLWSGDKAEQKRLKWLTKRRYRILFIDGCHENFDLLRDYPVEDFMGGRARHIGGNLYYIQRGSILEIEGKKLLCFGGAESWDKEDREEGVNWWRAELPTSDELEYCVESLQAAGSEVDYILTHDAPLQILEFTQLMRGQPNWLHNFFDQIMKATQYKKWLFGRYHKDLNFSPKVQAVFLKVVPLE